MENIETNYSEAGYQNIELCLIARTSESNVENTKGLMALVLLETVKVLYSFRSYEETKNYLVKAVKQN